MNTKDLDTFLKNVHYLSTVEYGFLGFNTNSKLTDGKCDLKTEKKEVIGHIGNVKTAFVSSNQLISNLSTWLDANYKKRDTKLDEHINVR